MANKLKLVLLCLFCAVFLMSYNVSAIEPIFDVYYRGSVNDVYFQDGNSTTWRHSNGFYFYGNNADYTSNARLFTLSNSSHAVSIPTGGYYVSVTGSFIAYSNIQDQFNASGTFGLSSQNTDCEVIDFDVNNIEAQNNSGTQQLTYKADFTLTCRVTSAISVGPTIPLTVNTVSNPGISQVGILFNNFMWWVSDVTGSQLLTAINNIYSLLQQNNSGTVLQQEKQDVADASQDGASAGTSSEQSVESSTQSLMSAGTSIISALTSAPATDCNINISTTGNSSAFTAAIGNLNLCSDVPSGVLTLVQGMVALVFTPIVLYYVYNILTLIYAQFKEYNS